MGQVERIERAGKPISDGQAATESEKEPLPEKHQVFLAFQGGGAKGVAHAGALLAINDLDLEIKGVSGTSAGSMIAALIAAGYRGSDLIDPEKKTHLFQTITPKFGITKATDIFSKRAWNVLKAVKNAPALIPFVRRSCNWISRFIPKPLKCWKRLSLTLGLTMLFLLCLFPPFAQIVAITSSFAVVMIAWLTFRVAQGISSVEKVRTLIDGAISEKLQTSKKNITFRELSEAGGLPLKIVSTNITGECLELFCLDRTPDTVIADAVAASICLPIIFSPWPIKFRRSTVNFERLVSGSFFDGGLMSNLPAWPFDEERLVHPGTTTIALGIGSASNSISKSGAKPNNWLGAVINAVVSGTGEIHTRAVGRIIKIPLKCDLKLLDFDAPIEKIYREVEKSRDQVIDQLRRELTVYPDLMRETTSVLQAAILAILEKGEDRWYRGSLAANTIRLALGTQRAGAMNTLSLVYGAGFSQHHPDNQITLPLASSAAGTAWREGALAMTLPFDDDVAFHARERMWGDVKWFMCIPVTPRPLLPIAPLSAARHRPPLTDGAYGELAKIRPIVIIIDGTMAYDETLPDAMTEMVECLERIQESVVSYLRGKNLDLILQGSNSWL